MADRQPRLGRRTVLGLLGVGVAGTLAGCAARGSGGRPASPSSGLVVRARGTGGALADLSSLRVHVETVGIDPQSGSSGALPSGATVDLTDGPTAVLTTHFPPDQYVRFSLNGRVTGATETDGSSASVQMPSDGLEYDVRYRLRPGKTVVLTAPVVVSKDSGGAYSLSAGTGDVGKRIEENTPTTTG